MCEDVATDGANGLVFAVGQIYNDDVEESSDFWFNARALDEATGETVWDYQDQSKIPSEVRAYVVVVVAVVVVVTVVVAS